MIDGLPVFITVPTIGQLAASRIGARTIGFLWHLSPRKGKQKSLHVFIRGSSLLFRHHKSIKGLYSHSITFTLIFQENSPPPMLRREAGTNAACYTLAQQKLLPSV